MPPTFLTTLARAIARIGEAYQLDVETIFAEAGLDPTLMEEPRSRYPYDRACFAWQKVAELTHNPHIGLQVPKYYHPFDLHALGVTFLCSDTLLEALTRIDRYENVLNTGLDYSIIEIDGGIRFICEGVAPPAESIRVIEDMRNAVLLDMCRRGADGVLDPVEVGFTYAEPMDVAEHLGYFRCPLRFSAATTYIAFAEADINRPFLAPNKDLAERNDRVLDRLLQDVDDSDLVTQVRHAIANALPSGRPTEALIAGKVLTSSRTLHRHLAAQGTSFRALLNSVRLELAEEYIADLSIPLTEISYLLGFSDSSAFSRAFKRWTGHAPTVYRRQLAANSVTG
jgi:AraC-like DNA-binding protein